jgi:predicted metalloenzyme YecM
MLTDKHEIFLDELFSEIKKSKLDISSMKLDHLGYRTKSEEDFLKLIRKFENIGKLVHENYIGGNKVRIYKLNTPLSYKSYKIDAVELIGPNETKVYPTGLEHAEFVVSEKYTDIIKNYPNLNWDTTAIDRSEFPMLKLPLKEFMQIKLINTPVLVMARMLNK